VPSPSRPHCPALYEIGNARYAGPDRHGAARLDLAAQRWGRPRAHRGVRGEPPPPTTKVAFNHLGGYRTTSSSLLVGLVHRREAALARTQIEAALVKRPAELTFTLARPRAPTPSGRRGGRHLARVGEGRCEGVGRALQRDRRRLAVSSYPGFNLTAPPGDGDPSVSTRPRTWTSKLVPHQARFPTVRACDRVRTETLPLEEVVARLTPAPPSGAIRKGPAAPSWCTQGTRVYREPGVWAVTTQAGHGSRTPHRRAFARVVARDSPFRSREHMLPIRGIELRDRRASSGQGVSSSTPFARRPRRSASGLRSRHVDVPEALLRR